MRSAVTAMAVASLALSAGGICQEPAAASGQILTLERAIHLALESNRLIKSADLELRKFEDRLAATRTKRLPALDWYVLGSQRLTTLDFLFPRGAFGVYPGVGPIPAANTAIRAPLQPAALLIGKVDQPLSQQYQIGLGLGQLKVGQEIAREQERLKRQTVVSDVKSAYYQILQTQSALESAEEAIRLYRELDRLTDQYVSQQVALKSESLEVKTRLAKAEYDALTLRNPLATQQEHLNSLMGRELATEFRVSPAPEANSTETDLAAARKLALERRPEVRQASLKVRQAEFDRRIKKAEYIPSLSLNFTYFSPVNYGGLVPSNIASVGLLLDWEPFDWGRKRHELAEKSKSVEEANLALKETEDQIAIEVGSKFRKLQEARQLVAIGRLAQETARENLRVAQNRYSQQASLLKDVLQVQTTLAQADNQYQQALLSFWNAKADFERALGEEE